MRNREKHPNTDDAVKAWRKHKDETGCHCSFEEWLDNDPDSSDDVVKSSVVVTLAGLLALRDFINNNKGDEPKDVKKKSGNIECPICHGKHGEIGGIIPGLNCPDCGAIIGKFSCFDDNEFKTWLANLGKAARKD